MGPLLHQQVVLVPMEGCYHVRSCRKRSQDNGSETCIYWKKYMTSGTSYRRCCSEMPSCFWFVNNPSNFVILMALLIINLLAAVPFREARRIFVVSVPFSYCTVYVANASHWLFGCWLAFLLAFFYCALYKIRNILGNLNRINAYLENGLAWQSNSFLLLQWKQPIVCAPAG